MRRWAYRAVLLLAGCTVASSAEEITFYKQVLPVLQERCQSCHRSGEAAPMAFLTYKHTRPWAAAIRETVS